MVRKRRTFAIGGVLLFGALVLVLSLGSSVGASVIPGGASSARSGSDAAAASQPGLSAGKVKVGHSSKNDVSPRLSSITPLVVTPGPNKQAVASPRIGHQRSARHDSVVQTKLSAPSMPSTGLNFDGIAFPGVNCNCAPPDTNGEVGATQYVQIVNTGLAGVQQGDRRLRARADQHRVALDRLRRRLPEQRRRRSGRPLRPARQPLGREPVRRDGSADPRVRRGLDLERRDRLVQPLRLRPRDSSSGTTSTTTRSSACGRTRTT